LDLLAMGILARLMRRHPPHHLSPARANYRRGRTLKAAQSRPAQQGSD
jgi:hypothetical protein